MDVLKMESLESAGHVVLYSYGHFLDSLLINLYSFNESFLPVKKLCNAVGLQTIQKEHSTAYDLIDTEKPEHKLLVVFYALCKEVEELKFELDHEYLNLVLQYGEDVPDEGPVEEVQIMFSNFLPNLLDVLNFLRRCQKVFIHFLKQLFLTFDMSSKKQSNNIINLKFQEVFKYIGDLLLLIVALDAAFLFDNENRISKHLNLLYQYVKLFPNDEEKVKITKVLLEIQNELLSGHIFQASLHNLFEKKICLTNYSHFPTYFNRYLRRRLSEVDSAKENEISAMQSWASIVVSHAFTTKCFGMTDKKLHKSILDLSKKFHTIPLLGDLIWQPGKFLAEHFDLRPMELSNRTNHSSILQKRLEQTEANSSKDVRVYSFLVYKWALLMENSTSQDAVFSKENGSDLSSLCIEGLQLSYQLKYCINNILQLCGIHGHPMTKMSVLNLCKLIELLKGVQSIFNRHHIDIAKQMNHIIQKHIMQALSMILQIKKEVFKPMFQEKYMDAYSSLLLSEKVLYGSCTEEKLLLLKLVLTVINHHPLLDSDVNESLLKFFNEFNVLCLMNDKIEDAMPFNFIFIEENLLPIYIKHLVDNHSDSTRLQYMLHNVQDEKVNSKYSVQRKQLLQNKVIKELYEEIEIHLRLQAHSHLKDDSALTNTQKHYLMMLHGTPVNVYNCFITVKGLVEAYLDETFYDLTTVALHDWQTYSEMRSLADHQFKLKTIQDNLPSQTLSQGLDMLKIMRNIHVFVSKYLYNLNTQCFIEHTSSNKHLNTIRIYQVANSIWTHGTGIMNTTVNFIYQFLRKKLLSCSQFLYDEHINCRLTKDLLYFNNQKFKKQSVYPYDLAEKFHKGINRLRLSSDGLSYLDQYRILISQIGNALGYVRMIRSGGVHHSLATATYFPLIEYSPVLEKTHEEPTKGAAECFDKTFLNVLHQLNGDTDALKLLVEVFQPVFHLPENEHLRLFVMIIPALTINFINFILTSKEKMGKRSSATRLFTDDGFALGLAYLLTVFNLHNDFNALHWFQSVNDKYDLEEKQLYESSEKKDKDETNHDSTMKLSFKRLLMYKQEFQLLQCNLDSSRVFFSCEKVIGVECAPIDEQKST